MKYLLILFIMISLSGCTIYRNLSEEDKLEFQLEKIDLKNHENQPDSLLYSIDSEELKKLMLSSEKKYHLVIMHTRTCRGCVYSMDKLTRYLDKIQNTSIYFITQSDQTRKEMYVNYYADLPYKRYMLDSEKYNFDRIDGALGQSHGAKDKFIAELCKDCIGLYGTFGLMLFDKAGNNVFFTDSEYLSKVYIANDRDEDRYLNQLGPKLFSDITKITNK